MSQIKQCAGCTRALPIAAFGKKGEDEHGRSQCKECNNIASRDSRLNTAGTLAAGWLLAAHQASAVVLDRLDVEALGVAVKEQLVHPKMALALRQLAEFSTNSQPVAETGLITYLSGMPPPSGRHLRFQSIIACRD